VNQSVMYRTGKRVMADEHTFVSLLEFWLGRKVGHDCLGN
jgi:hypothetical protein